MCTWPHGCDKGVDDNMTGIHTGVVWGIRGCCETIGKGSGKWEQLAKEIVEILLWKMQ
jgi:hypothetical protein